MNPGPGSSKTPKVRNILARRLSHLGTELSVVCAFDWNAALFWTDFSQAPKVREMLAWGESPLLLGPLGGARTLERAGHGAVSVDNRLTICLE